MKNLFVWLMRTLLVLGACLAVIRPDQARAQSSSLFRRLTADTPGLAVRPARTNTNPREKPSPLQQASYLALKPLPKRVITVGSLLTVIVRQKSTYRHNGKSDLQRELEIKAELKDWVRFSRHKLVPDTLPAGDPKINFALERTFEGEGKKNRRDEVITRITCRIIDVKPNGNLVLQGNDVIKTDGETQIITLTGTCRSEDIKPDNTILSTQIVDLRVDRQSEGAIRDAMRRGWVYRFWDKIRPF